MSMPQPGTMSDLAPAISIALATYNGARFLEAQLASLAAQSMTPFELVVTDDRSTDETVTILRDFATHAPFPVQVHINDTRLGYRRNFRRAARLCTGELIAFCDQDDVWLPDKLATVVAAFADPDVLLVYHNVRLMDAGGTLMGRLCDPDQERRTLALKPLPPIHFSFGLTQTFRADLRMHDDLWDMSLDHLKDEILAHDQWYMFLALALGRVRFLTDELIRYRQHGANTYGSSGARSRWQRLLDRFALDPVYDRRGSASAASKAAVLRAITERTGRTDLAEAVRCYDLLSERLGRRYRTHSQPGMAVRAAAFARSVGAGDYCGNPWGFDWKSLPRDLLTGVLRGGLETPPSADSQSGH